MSKEFLSSLPEVMDHYSQCNLLLPTSTDVQLNPFYKFHVEEVPVDLGENSGDIFKVGSVDSGKKDRSGNTIWVSAFSLTKPMLNKLARLPVINKKQIGSLKLVNKQISSGKLVELPSEISNEQRSILEQIYDLYDKNEEQKKMVTENFSLEWKKRETLSSLLKWWNDIPMAFDITTVGTVLAHANAQRCDSSIPPLE